MNVLINSSINVDKRIDMVQRIQELTSFRRHNLTPDPGEKRGNYLFHYINDGQIVMERYFERKKRKRPEEKEDEDIEDDAASSHSPSSSSHSSSPSSSNKKKRSATSFSSESDNKKKKLENGDQESKNRDEGIQQEVKEGQESDAQQEEQIISEGKNLLKPFFTSLRASAEGTSGRKREGSEVTFSTSVTRQTTTQTTTQTTSQTTTSIHEVRAEALKLGRGSFSLSRSRFVLFANLGHTPRVKDLRDKFHLGSIKVTSNPKRIRDFLYFRSLKLDPGEAIIAQVE